MLLGILRAFSDPHFITIVAEAYDKNKFQLVDGFGRKGNQFSKIHLVNKVFFISEDIKTDASNKLSKFFKFELFLSVLLILFYVKK